MIKIGIAGADTLEAGELLRLCLHHPDANLVTAYAPSRAGLPVGAVHHGFIGEERMLFSSNFDATALDVAFLLMPLYSENDWVKLMADRPQLKLILFKNALSSGMESALAPVYGLSEMNRKPLVRGARVAVVPDTIASPVLVALYPLARHLILSGNIVINLTAPADVILPERLESASEEIRSMLKRLQTSFTGSVTINANPSGNDRFMQIEMALTTQTNVEEVFRMYDSIYDDHNFAFAVHHAVTPAEVAGTDKVVISVTKPAADRLQLVVVADPRMRRGAGEAIHLMNLLFSLHEKTGLDLKTSAWTK